MLNLPTGRLRAGRARVAGVTSEEVRSALVALKEERGLPTFSQAVGVALQEWLEARYGGVLHPGSVDNRGRGHVAPRAQEKRWPDPAEVDAPRTHLETTGSTRGDRP